MYGKVGVSFRRHLYIESTDSLIWVFLYTIIEVLQLPKIVVSVSIQIRSYKKLNHKANMDS